MKCVVSCDSTSFPWLLFFFGALLWGFMIHKHTGRWMWQGSASVVSWNWEKYSCQSKLVSALSMLLLSVLSWRVSQVWNIYVSGVPFTVVTDHSPLLTIWDKPSPHTGITRWALRPQPYAVTMQYKPGKDNPADYMSRHPSNKNIVSSQQEKMAEQYVNFILNSDVPTALTLKKIQSATAQRPTLQSDQNHEHRQMAWSERNYSACCKLRCSYHFQECKRWTLHQCRTKSDSERHTTSHCSQTAA